MATSLGLITSSALLALGAANGDWPVKTIDPSEGGSKCEYVCSNGGVEVLVGQGSGVERGICVGIFVLWLRRYENTSWSLSRRAR